MRSVPVYDCADFFDRTPHGPGAEEIILRATRDWGHV